MDIGAVRSPRGWQVPAAVPPARRAQVGGVRRVVAPAVGRPAVGGEVGGGSRGRRRQRWARRRATRRGGGGGRVAGQRDAREIGRAHV